MNDFLIIKSYTCIISVESLTAYIRMWEGYIASFGLVKYQKTY